MSIKDLTTKVTPEDLSTARESLRLDDDTDEKLLQIYIKAARNDIIRQVGERIDDYFDNNDIFNAAVLIEVGHLYNHREATSEQQEFEVPMALYSLINSLKDEYRRLVCEADNEDGSEKTENQQQESNDKQAVDSSQSSEKGDKENDQAH